MKNRRNYYRILHLQPDAPPEMIKVAYRTLMQRLRHHPDLGGDPWDAGVINEAYEVLSDQARRRRYDEMLGVSAGGFRRGAFSSEESSGAASGSARAREVACVFCGEKSHMLNGVSHERCGRCGTPLQRMTPKEPRGFTLDARRRFVRTRFHAPTIVECPGSAERFDARMLDVSPRGVRISLLQPLDEGVIVRVENSVLVAAGRVRYRDEVRSFWRRAFVVGLSFVCVEFKAEAGTLLSFRA